MLSKSELRDACETAEKESATSELVQILLGKLPTFSPDQCPGDAREEWLELNLMVQPRPLLVSSPGWLVRLREWMSKPSLATQTLKPCLGHDSFLEAA